MRSLALITLSLWAFLGGCQPRKSSLLPPRSTSGGDSQTLQARSPTSELPASADGESEGRELRDDPLSESEISDLQKVKQDALDRLRELARPLPSDPKQAKLLLRRARALVLEDRVNEAQEYHLAACQMGQVEGCHKFGWYEEKAGNWQNAGQFYKTACSGGSAKSCNNLGLQLEKQEKWEAALDVYAQACLERNSKACENLKRARKKQFEAQAKEKDYRLKLR